MLTLASGGRCYFYPAVTDTETEARGDTASKWWSQDLNPGSRVPQPELLSPHHRGEDQRGSGAPHNSVIGWVSAPFPTPTSPAGLFP